MGPQNMTGGGSKQCRIPATQTWAVARGVGKKIKKENEFGQNVRQGTHRSPPMSQPSILGRLTQPTARFYKLKTGYFRSLTSVTAGSGSCFSLMTVIRMSWCSVSG